MSGQAFALVALKWQLFRNTLSKGRLIGHLLSAFVTFAVFVFALGAGFGLYLLGKHLASLNDPVVFLLALNVVILAYLAFVLLSFFSDIQRQDQFDFRTLLHLPISMPAAYLLNFGISLFNYALIFLLLGAAGLFLGLSETLGVLVWSGLPLALLFHVMVTAWLYHLRGWVATLLLNKRRRRTLLTLVPIMFILLFQLPSIISRNLLTSGQNSEEWIALLRTFAQEWIHVASQISPSGWMPYAYQQVLFGSLQSAFIFTFAMCLFTLLGLRLGYRATSRFYLSGAREESGARGKENARTYTSLRLPLLDDDTSAMTVAAFLTYLRHPNIRMMFVMPFLMGGVILLMYHPELRERYEGYTPRWMPIVLLLWPYFNFTMLFFNLFGVDGHGFRGLMLLPTPRYKLLLAKNLALFPLVAGVNFLFVVLGNFVSPFHPMTLLIIFIHVFILFFTLCIPGNFLTLYLPYRIGFDAMRRRGNRPVMFIIGLVTPIIMGVLFIPTALCLLADGYIAENTAYPPLPFGLVFSLLLMGVVAIAYRKSLIYAGDLFVDRESKMLESLIRNLD